MQPRQIYSLIFGTTPFHQYLGGLDVLVGQMIGFVEELPMEWQNQWGHIQQNSGLAREPLTSMLLLNAYSSSMTEIKYPAARP